MDKDQQEDTCRKDAVYFRPSWSCPHAPGNGAQDEQHQGDPGNLPAQHGGRVIGHQAVQQSTDSQRNGIADMPGHGSSAWQKA